MILEAELVRELRLRATMMAAESILDDMPVERPSITLNADLFSKLVGAARSSMSPTFLKDAILIEARANAGFVQVQIAPELLIHMIDIAAPELDKADVTMQF